MANQFYVRNKRVALGTGVALIANVIIFLFGSSTGAKWEVGLPFTVGLPMIAFATIFPMLLGGFIVGFLSKRKQSIVGLASWLVLAFSIAGSPGGYIASQNIQTGLALGTMHLVVGAAWFVAIRSKK